MRFGEILSEISARASRYKFALAIFLVSLAIRAIPEVLSGPYPVGFDTISFYVPNTIDWTSMGLSPLETLAASPMMYFFTVPIYLLTKTNPILIYKVAGPALFGALMLATFRFCSIVLSWTEKTSFSATLLASVYFVVLRVSWDAYRVELGLVFFLLGMSAKGGRHSIKMEVLKSILFSAAILSNELVALLVGASIIFDWLRAFGREAQTLRISQVVPFGVLGLTAFAILQSPMGAGLSIVNGSPSPSTAFEASTFALYCYWLILPLALLGAQLARNAGISFWLIACGLGIGASALPGSLLQSVGDRWVLLLAIPTLLMAFQGYGKLCASLSRRRGAAILRLSFLVVIVTLATLYSLLPSQAAFPYFAQFPNSMPSSLAQSSIPLSDGPYVVQSMKWLSKALDGHSVLIAHLSFYGWARAYLDPRDNVINSLLSPPQDSLDKAAQFTHVFTVWWTPGNGWYGIHLSGYSPIMVYGDIAIYELR